MMNLVFRGKLNRLGSTGVFLQREGFLLAEDILLVSCLLSQPQMLYQLQEEGDARKSHSTGGNPSIHESVLVDSATDLA